MKRVLFTIGLLLAVLAAGAQASVKLPVDKGVRIGHLDNGLTYYIRHNEQPKQRCEFHIAQAVGAVLEEDDQNGLAHFLEHMAFNGTEHFAGKGIIDYFESIGVNFGGNINAYTSIDETVYRLSDVPTIREGIIDSALLVMHDWACGLSLLPEEIDAERGVIREEWRTVSNANRRLYKKINALKYPNTQYGKRDVIGDTAVINNFAYDALRSYYKKWYGPDNQAVIVVGDIDVDEIEAKIKELWKNVPARVNRGERPLYTVNFNTEPRAFIALDKEAQATHIEIEWLHQQRPAQERNTLDEYTENLCHSLIAQIINNRFSELALNPDAPFTGAGIGYGEAFKLKDMFYGVINAKEGRETEAYQVLLEELERMRRYGFTEAELQRAKTNTLNSYERSYNGRTTRDNISYAREYIRNFENAESIPGIEWEYNFVQKKLPAITTGMLLPIAQRYMHDNPTVSVTGPEKEGTNIPTEKQLIEMYLNMPALNVEAPKEEVINTQLVKKAPRTGKIKEETYNDVMGTTEWMLSNGIRVIIKPTKFKEDEISLHAYSEGGTSVVPTEDLTSAVYASDIVGFMGRGDFSQIELSKALTGKSASMSTSLDTYQDNLWGSSSVKDFETMLQLVYLGFTAPHRDDQAFETWKGHVRNSLLNREKNHKAIFGDSVALTSTGHSDRTFILTMEKLEQINLDKVLSIYKERFANPGEFTFVIVGNIDPKNEDTRKAVAKWIGGLKTKKDRETWVDHGVRTPFGKLKNYFTRDMEINTATNRIQYTSYDIPFTLSNALNMEMIGRVLSTRYLESIREREGGSYGVGCGGSLGRLPVPCARLIMQFDTDPDKQERLMQIIHEEVMTIVENGPLATDLQKEKESMLKDYKEHLEQNGWWRGVIETYYKYGENRVEDYPKAVEAITRESVQAMLKQLVAAGNVFEVVMSPANK